MGTISKIYDGYVAFATDDGTIHDNSTLVLLGGAVLILLLSAFIAYNVVMAITTTVRRSVMATARGVVGISHAVGRKAEIAVPAAAIPVQRIVPAAQVGTGRPIVRREVAKIG